MRKKWAMVSCQGEAWGAAVGFGRRDACPTKLAHTRRRPGASARSASLSTLIRAPPSAATTSRRCTRRWCSAAGSSGDRSTRMSAALACPRGPAGEHGCDRFYRGSLCIPRRRGRSPGRPGNRECGPGPFDAAQDKRSPAPTSPNNFGRRDACPTTRGAPLCARAVRSPRSSPLVKLAPSPRLRGHTPRSAVARPAAACHGARSCDRIWGEGSPGSWEQYSAFFKYWPRWR